MLGLEVDSLFVEGLLGLVDGFDGVVVDPFDQPFDQPLFGVVFEPVLPVVSTGIYTYLLPDGILVDHPAGGQVTVPYPYPKDVS